MKKIEFFLIHLKKLVIILLFIFIIFIQYNYDKFSPPFTTKLKEARRTLLPESFVTYTHFGFKNILADFYWIRSIQDFIAWNGKEGFFVGYLKNITALDPKFEYPYLFNILTVPQRKEVERLDEVAEISQRGIDNIPTSWKIPFYLGTQYYLFTKTYDKAEKYLEIASKIEGSPDGVFLIYSSFVSKNKDKNLNKKTEAEISQNLFKVIYKSTDNQTIKKIAELGYTENRLKELIEKGIIAYNLRYGRFPKNVDELINVRFISLPKKVREAFFVEINEKNGSFKIIKR